MFYRALVVVALLLFPGFPACDDSLENTSHSSDHIHTDIDTVINGTEVACYFAGNSVADEAATSLRARAGVRDGLERLEATGYLLDPSASLVVRGLTEEGREVTITILGFMSIEHPQAEVVYLMNFESEGRSTWAPFRYVSRRELAGPDAVLLTRVCGQR